MRSRSLSHAIDEATTAISMSVLVDIKQIWEDTHDHDFASEEERDNAMRQHRDFQDDEVCLMVKLGYTNPPHPLVKCRLQKLDAEARKAEHTHSCGASAVDEMTKEKRMQRIVDKLEVNGTFNHQEAE